MSEQAVDERLAQARAAVSRAAWIDAYDLLSELDSSGALSANDLGGLARACHWTGRMDECLGAWERAYGLYLEAGETRSAGVAALELVRWHRHKLAPAVATGWLRRAERLLADDPECVEYGYLQLRRASDALVAGDLEPAVRLAQEAQEIGDRFGDRDLELMAQHEHGVALVQQGDLDQGFALIDEAAAAAVGGELGPYATAAVYCNTIGACRGVADYRRASDWTEAAKRWCDRQTINGFPGMCRVYRAEVMRLRGDWTAAREDAQSACDELRDWSPATAAEAFYELGEIRLRTGDLEGAEDAFRQAHELGREPAPGLALLRLMRGDANGAAALLDRALAEETRDWLARARLLPAKVELALAVDRAEEAAAAAAELREIADRYESPALAGAATAAEASVALARNDPAGATTLLRAALQSWRLADVPYEAARVRMLLADAYTRQGDIRAATLELEAAHAVFERLGAVPDARLAERMLPPDGGETSRRSFLFTDMVGSTTLAGALGDEAWSTLVAWHDRMLRELFAEHGGEEVDRAGDGFFVSFGDEKSALACAVAVQRCLAEHRADHGFAPSIRMGVHAADAHRADSSFRGRGVHEAARIAALAAGGEILASAETAAAVGIPHSVPHTVELKGVPEPVEIVSIDWR